MSDKAKQNKLLKVAAKSIAIGAVLYGLRYLYIKYSRKWNGLPSGPIAYFPLIGHALSLSNNRYFFIYLSKNYGTICTFNLGLQSIVYLNDPKIIYKIWNTHKQIEKKMLSLPPKYMAFSNYNHISRRSKIIKSQLVTMLNTKFVDKIITKTMNDFIFDKFDEICKKKISFKPLNFCENITFNTLFCAVFGDKYINFNGAEFYEYHKYSKQFIGTVIPLYAVQIMYGDYLVKMTTLHQKHIKAKAKLFDITMKYYQTIENNTKCFANYIKNEYLTDNKYNKYNQDDIIEDNIICDMMTMIAAGMDTTAHILCIMILYLAKYPKIQNEIFNELQNVFSIHQTLQYLQLHKLRAFIYEILRLYPGTVMITPRRLNKDIIINNQYTLKKGTYVIHSPYAANRNSKYFNVSHVDMTNIDLNEVNLKLWIDEINGKFINVNKRNVIMIPFGTGLKDCPGQSIAIKQLLLTLSLFISKYQIFTKDINQFFINLNTRSAFQVIDHSTVFLKKR